MDALKLILDFIEKNIWAIIFFIFIVINRKSISNVFERLIKLNFSIGNATGAVEAQPISNGGKISQSEPIATASPLESTEKITGAIENSIKDEDQSPWILRLYNAIEKHDKELTNQIYSEAQAKEPDPTNKLTNELYLLYFSYLKNREQKDLTRIEDLFKGSQNEHQSNISSGLLGSIYNTINDNNKLIDLWENQIKTSKNEKYKTEYTIKLSSALSKIGKSEQATQILQDRLNQCSDNEQKSDLYQAIAEREKGGSKFRRALALELSAKHAPGDSEKLFDAAYSASQCEIKKASLSNYQALLKFVPKHSTALNNLGVCASELKLDGKKVELYKKSSALGSTLAMANLTQIYISSGLFDEAHHTIESALKDENRHENISNVMTFLRNKEESEEESWRKATEESEQFERDLLQFGSDYFKPLDTSVWLGTWIVNGKPVEISIEGNKLTSSWLEPEIPVDGEEHFSCSLSGVIHGSAAEITYSRKSSKHSTNSLLGTKNSNEKYLAFIPANSKQVKIFSTGEEKVSLDIRRS